MKESHGPRDAAGKPFQLLNSIITGDDITPLPRGGNNDSNNNNNNNNEDQNQIQEEGSPNRRESSSSSGADAGGETTPDPDLLFSPLNAGFDEGDEEDEYDHDFLSPVYFGAPYPKRFHRRSSLTHVQPDRRSSFLSSSSLSHHPLGEFLINAKNDDFWKEVGTTDEEALCFPEIEKQNGSGSSTNEPLQEPSSSQESQEDLTQFISEDLGSAQPVDSSSWDQDCRIKLLCYRDAEGKLRLRNANSSDGGSGRVQKKSKKLLRRAIRRKSGVREMVSTGIGIGEFML
ncbi:hypothetical protein ZYGM_003393 [Zygosaccharomyces mellis]|uniref:Uncharacterized protein n=1 Tax=Zygosaccharomyces mellis TaxID=42258 RepID=A0A4C2EAT6_9SACH|nr:hypothetical protein ZYGM_003393 [Zygosaccharomyces mellis]